jgi:hypothetical protein
MKKQMVWLSGLLILSLGLPSFAQRFWASSQAR